MKSLLVAVLMVLITAAQVSGEENDPKEDTDYWTSTNQIQVFIQTYTLSLIIHKYYYLNSSSFSLLQWMKAE